MFRNGTYIPTPAGWRVIEDLSIGDMVFDESLRPVQVIHVASMGARIAHAVVFRWSAIATDADHPWVTLTQSHIESLGGEMPYGWSDPGSDTITTREIGETIDDCHMIPICRPFNRGAWNINGHHVVRTVVDWGESEMTAILPNSRSRMLLVGEEMIAVRT